MELLVFCDVHRSRVSDNLPTVYAYFICPVYTACACAYFKNLNALRSQKPKNLKSLKLF